MAARRRMIGIAAAAIVAASAGLALVVTLRSDSASANQCASACYAAHSQCRIARKGSPACDSQLSRCLASCGKR